MANAAQVTTLSTLRQRNLIERAVELKAIRDAAQSELDEILGEFKLIGDGDYAGRDGRSVQVRTSERVSLDSKVAKGFLTPAQIVSATKTSFVTTATVR